MSQIYQPGWKDLHDLPVTSLVRRRPSPATFSTNQRDSSCQDSTSHLQIHALVCIAPARPAGHHASLLLNSALGSKTLLRIRDNWAQCFLAHSSSTEGIGSSGMWQCPTKRTVNTSSSMRILCSASHPFIHPDNGIVGNEKRLFPTCKHVHLTSLLRGMARQVEARQSMSSRTKVAETATHIGLEPVPSSPETHMNGYVACRILINQRLDSA